MDVSLFMELSSAHSDAVVTLNLQYRMNESIMSLANALVYNNLMKCGNSAIATSRLCLPKYEQIRERYDKGRSVLLVLSSLMVQTLSVNHFKIALIH